MRSGGHLHLAGQMNGRLIVEKGASLDRSGQLNGTAKIMGTLDVTGQLHGPPRLTAPGRLTFATGSMLVRSGQPLILNDVGEFQPPHGALSYVIGADTPR